MINNGLPNNKYVYSITVIGSSLFAVTSHQELYKSTDNGTHWIPTTFNTSAYCIASNGKDLFVGSYGLYIAPSNGIFLSTDSEITWISINSGLPGSYVRSLAYVGSKLFAGIYSRTGETNSGPILRSEGVFISTNNGTNWKSKNTGLANTSIKSFVAGRSNLFTTTNNGGLYIYKDLLDQWVSITNGLPYSAEYLIAANETDLFVATYYDGIWKRPLNEIITGINKIINSLPENFSLSQNYPNPFNPTTIIKFSIPNSQFATLKIYDILGREIATLVNEEKLPGNYEVKFNESNLASGVYLYRLQAGSFSQTKKFVLMK